MSITLKKLFSLIIVAMMLFVVSCNDIQQISEGDLTCTISIDCKTILDNMDALNPDKAGLVPEDGFILEPTTVPFSAESSAFDVLVYVTQAYGIHMEHEFTPMYNSAYIEGIGNLYEFDCGELSGWTYFVNGIALNYGCSSYVLNDGDIIEWRYTCDLGRDVGIEWGE